MSESMSEAWEEWLALEKSNIETLEIRIENLSSNHGESGEVQYNEFWSDANEIAEMLKTVSPIPEEEKERLSAWHNRICRDVKKKQEQEWQNLRLQSQQKRESIESKIREACACADYAPEDIGMLSMAQAMLSEALAWLKNDRDDTDTEVEPAEMVASDGKLLREDRRVCWDRWREANDSIFGRRKAIWDQNYEQVHPMAAAAFAEANDGDPFQALDKVKEAQNYVKENALNNSQRVEVRGLLNSAWETAISKVNDIREGKRRKHEEWLGRMGTQVERWTDLIRQNKEEASELEGQIKRMASQTKTSRSGEQSEVLRKWIGEKRQKIREINEMNVELEEKIKAIKEKLGSQV